MIYKEAEMPHTRYWVQVTLLVLIRPWLWRSALRFIPRLRGLKYLGRYIRFRLTTMYGTSKPQARDIVPYLNWCRKFNKIK